MRIDTAIFLTLVFCLAMTTCAWSQRSNLERTTQKINSILPELQTNDNSRAITAQSNIEIDGEGYLILNTKNKKENKVYDEAKFRILASQIDLNKLRVKSIPCCSVLEFYCIDRSFACVEYLDRTSRQKKPIPYLLLDKSREDSEEIVTQIKNLIKGIGSADSQTTIGNQDQLEIPLQARGGVYFVGIKVANSTYEAILDSGASVISISKKLESIWLRNKVISRSDYIEPARYRIATGRIIRAKRFILPELSIKGLKVKNVTCSVVESNSPILLGKSFLDLFRKWSIDNERQSLVLDLSK